MKSVKEIIANNPTPWTGSKVTASIIKNQIERRWTKEEAENFDPTYDARTFRGWREQNCIVNKGETGLQSFVLIERKDDKGKVIKYHKKIWLFYRKQVSPISN